MNFPVMNRFAILVIALAAILGVSGASHAQPAVKEHMTPGGIAFRHAHVPRAPFQSIQIAWRNSYAMMLPGKQGVGSLGAGLIMQGPKGTTRGEFAEDIKDLQARFALSTTTHFTLASFTAPTEKVEKAADLFIRTMTEPALDPAHLEELRQGRLLGQKRSETTPESMARIAAMTLRIPPSPLREWTIGRAPLYETVSIDDIETWRKATLVREGVMIVSAGPLDVAETGRLIDRLMAPLPARGTVVAPAIPALLASKKTIVIEAETPQTILHLSSLSGFMSTPDIVRGQLAARILRARLFAAVRGKLGAAYGVSAGLGAIAREPYNLTIQGSVDHDKVAEALTTIRAEYARFLASGITASELEPEKTKAVSEHKESLRRVANVAGAMRSALLSGYPVDHVRETESRIAAIKVEDVNADIRDKLAGRDLMVIIVAPSAAPFNADCVIKSLAEIETCR